MKCFKISKSVFGSRQIIYFTVIFLFLGLIIFQPVLAQDPLVELKKTVEGTVLETETEVPVLVGRLIKVVLQLLGLILVVLLIVGGFMWMTSGGNEEKIKKAKGIITSAVVGLVIIILAYTIATFVIERLGEITAPE